MIYASIDIGLSGGICITTDTTLHVQLMPTRTIIDKPATTIFAKDSSNKKILIKSGPNKGEFKRVIRTPAKTHKELDTLAILKLLTPADILLIETPALGIGNASRTTATVNRNYGKLLAIAEILSLHTIPIPPHVWKGSKTSTEGRTGLNLGRDKSVAISFVEGLLSRSTLDINQRTFKTSGDGLAESIAILHYYNKELLCLNT